LQFRPLPSETVGAPAGNVDVVGQFGTEVITDLGIGFDLNDAITLSVVANNRFDIYPQEVIRSNAQRLGADTGGVFRSSVFNPLPYSGAFDYSRLSVSF
jgi:iron complex outermembrane receptor protein